MPARPFLKWAGGKTQLLRPLLELLPTKCRTYYEPFVGGGAVFFAMAAEGRFQHAVVNDWNAELVNCYEVIQGSPDDLVECLGSIPFGKEHFERLKAQDPLTLDPVARAARTVYLNKTGFNGLYRVSKKAGKFNVPFGKWAKPPKVLDEPNIRACSAVLAHGVDVRQGDFSDAVAGAGLGDVAYFDPPYVPVSPTANFLGYTSKGFGLKDQEQLAEVCRTLVSRGTFVVASNADTEITRRLYEGFELHEVKARRAINSKGSRRGPVDELIMVGRPG